MGLIADAVQLFSPAPPADTVSRLARLIWTAIPPAVDAHRLLETLGDETAAATGLAPSICQRLVADARTAGLTDEDAALARSLVKPMTSRGLAAEQLLNVRAVLTWALFNGSPQYAEVLKRRAVDDLNAFASVEPEIRRDVVTAIAEWTAGLRRAEDHRDALLAISGVPRTQEFMSAYRASLEMALDRESPEVIAEILIALVSVGARRPEVNELLDVVAGDALSRRRKRDLTDIRGYLDENSETLQGLLIGAVDRSGPRNWVEWWDTLAGIQPASILCQPPVRSAQLRKGALLMWFYLVLLGLVAMAAYLCVVFVAPIVFVIATLIALGVALVEFATSSASVFRGATASIDHLKMAPPPEDPSGPNPAEPAYRSYYFGPVFRDYGYMVSGSSHKVLDRVIGSGGATHDGSPRLSGGSLAQRLYWGWQGLVRSSPGGPTAAKVITWVPMAAGMVGLGAGLVVACVAIAVVSMVFGLVLGSVVLVSVLLAMLLRIIEKITLRMRGISIECPSCHAGAVSPWYACPHCWSRGGSEFHRRLIPGSYGTFFRVCRCGNKLPTLLILGKWKLQGYCQRCHEPLPTKVLTAPTFHVPVVAGRSAGKTAYMMAAVARMEQQNAADPKFAFEFADESVIDGYKAAYESLARSSFDRVLITRPNMPKAFNIYLGRGSARRLLYLYDAAGELYEDEARVGTLGYLEHSGGVVIVIDPFSFRSVRRAAQSVSTDARASVADAEDVIGRFVEGLRRSVRGRAARKLQVRAAVVITKCDALARSTAVPHPFEDLGENPSRADRSSAARRWLTDQGNAGGLVTSIENTFGSCEYFAVSALNTFREAEPVSARTLIMVREDDVAAPVQWLMSGHGTP